MAGVQGVALVAVPVWLYVHVEVCGESVLFWRTWAPGCHSNATVHRHPHLNARALCSLLPLTGTPTYAQKSWGGHPRCDLAPLTTSFGTVGQWERQHLAMAERQALKSWGGHPRCDLAPQSTSFGTVALRERQHLAMTGSDTVTIHSTPPHTVPTTTFHSGAVVRQSQQVAGVRGLQRA